VVWTYSLEIFFGEIEAFEAQTLILVQSLLALDPSCPKKLHGLRAEITRNATEADKQGKRELINSAY